MKLTLAHLVLTQAVKPHITTSGGEDGNRGIALIFVAIVVAAIFAAGFYIGRKTVTRK